MSLGQAKECKELFATLQWSCRAVIPADHEAPASIGQGDHQPWPEMIWKMFDVRLKDVSAFKPLRQRDGINTVKHGRATQASAYPNVEAEVEELIHLTSWPVLFTDNRTTWTLVVMMKC